MPRKGAAPPLLQQLSNLLKISIFLPKLKKSMIPKLVFLKKTRKLKKFKLLSQYNYYEYVKEYEFSPSSTPLIQFRKKMTRNARISLRKLYSDRVFFVSECLGLRSRGEGQKEKCCLETGLGLELELEPYLGFTEPELGIDLSSEEDDSVDEKAERFIQRFYEEMRRQKLEI